MSNWQYSQSGQYEYAYGEGQAYIRAVGVEEWSSLGGPTANASMATIRGIYRAKEGPFTWRYKGDTWNLERVTFEESSSSSAPVQQNRSLYLVLQNQAPGEPKHWSLFVSSEGERGDVYQVKGDAEMMAHQHKKSVDIFRSASFHTSYTIVQDLPETSEAWVKYYAEHETPPSAPNRAAVRENCQGWSYRVLTKLSEQGIITKETLTSVEAMIEPIN
jgi:hypothetical protein